MSTTSETNFDDTFDDAEAALLEEQESQAEGTQPRDGMPSPHVPPVAVPRDGMPSPHVPPAK